jgi:Planctomycete cytochrome C.
MKTIYFIGLSLLLFIGCDDTNTVQSVDGTEIPASNVSYGKYIQPVFNTKCNNSGCHNDSDLKGGISLTSWTNATADPSVVFAGKPETSRLAWAIQSQNGAKQMPPLGYAALTKNQITGIVTWIKEGAKNN